MNEIISISGLGNSVLGTILNLFNLKSIRTRAEFEKIIEPSYLSVKELHNDYIKSFIDYKSVIRASNMNLWEMDALINKIGDDILLSENLRSKLVAITYSISDENKKYSEYLNSLLTYIDCIILKRKIRFSYMHPSLYKSYESKIFKNIENNEEIIIDKKLLKKMVGRNNRMELYLCSNSGRLTIIEKLEALIRGINNDGRIKKRIVNEIDFYITLLNINMKHIDRNYWEMKKDIYK